MTRRDADLAKHLMGLAPPDDIVAALKDYRLKLRERDGWRTRGTGYRFEPIGQAWHHDAISEAMSDTNAEAMLANGRPDLRGPLCNDAVDSDATVVLIAYGNANHAGWNERDVIDRLRAGKAPLGDARLDPDGDTVVGNPYLWGHECRNTGTHGDVWEQLDAMERLGAALCDVNGWPSEANAAHRELTDRKPDPIDIHMPTFRADIRAIRIAHHLPEETDMFVMTCTGKPTRLVSPMGIPVIDGKTIENHRKAGTKFVPYEPDDYADQLKHAEEMLGRTIVGRLADVEDAVKAAG